MNKIKKKRIWADLMQYFEKARKEQKRKANERTARRFREQKFAVSPVTRKVHKAHR